LTQFKFIKIRTKQTIGGYPNFLCFCETKKLNFKGALTHRFGCHREKSRKLLCWMTYYNSYCMRFINNKMLVSDALYLHLLLRNM